MTKVYSAGTAGFATTCHSAALVRVMGEDGVQVVALDADTAPVPEADPTTAPLASMLGVCWRDYGGQGSSQARGGKVGVGPQVGCGGGKGRGAGGGERVRGAGGNE